MLPAWWWELEGALWRRRLSPALLGPPCARCPWRGGKAGDSPKVRSPAPVTQPWVYVPDAHAGGREAKGGGGAEPPLQHQGCGEGEVSTTLQGRPRQGSQI